MPIPRTTEPKPAVQFESRRARIDAERAAELLIEAARTNSTPVVRGRSGRRRAEGKVFRSRRLLDRAPGRPKSAVNRVLRRRTSTLGTLGATASTAAFCMFVTVIAPQPATAAPAAGARLAVVEGVDFTPRIDATAAPERDSYSIDHRRLPSGDVELTGSAMSVIRPVDGSVPTAGHFGARQVSGCAACSTDHQGLDFAAPAGTVVRSVLPGAVQVARTEGGYGMTVVVRHDDGMTTRYAHLSRISVVAGQRVAGGTEVGRVGSTGISTGAHLHFEVSVGGVVRDPAPWLRAAGAL
jgi:hypothetical protein